MLPRQLPSHSTQTSAQFERLRVISCTLGRVKIVVADEARKRLRELQVGWPVDHWELGARP
jgi:hypothetical protein